MLKLLICGIPPGPSGVGRLMSSLIINRLPGIILMYPGDSFLLKSLNLKSFRWWKEAFQHLSYICVKFLLYSNIPVFSEVVLIHPQTLGLKWTSRVLERNQSFLSIYVMDSIYFCRRSYNYIPLESRACLRCLYGDFSYIKRYDCQPIMKNKEQGFLNFMKALEKRSDKENFKFYVQSCSYELLIRERFGHNVSVKNIGLWMEEFKDPKNKIKADRKFDFVFHGGAHVAKGSLWAIGLAREFSDYSFYFPFLKAELNEDHIPSNCFFEDKNWENGLENILKSAKICLIPSLWSAPIEGAVIKSLNSGVKCIIVNEATLWAASLSHPRLLKVGFELNEKDLESIHEFLNLRCDQNFDYPRINILEKLFGGQV